MKEYSKSYKSFVVLLIVYTLALLSLALIKTDDVQLLTLLIDNITSIWVAMLAYVVYKTEKIYWYNSITFEQAKNASSESRKKYAFAHFKKFGIFAFVYLAFSVIAYYTIIPVAFEIFVFVIGLIAVAVSTIKIKLEE